LSWPRLWSSASPEKLSAGDKFTALPERKSRSPRSLSRSPSRSPSSRVPDRPLRPPRIDSSVLPSSPRVLTSPPLEAQLFFGPVSSLLASGLHSTVASGPTSSAATRDIPPGDPRQDEAQHHRRLHTSRQPSLLPFPSTPNNSPYHHRLTKKAPTPSVTATPERPAPSVAQSSTTPTPMSSSSPSRSKGDRARSPAERYTSRHDALNKVEEILAKSWSDRELRGGECPGSPTKFGAMPAGVASPVLSAAALQMVDPEDGIEQRLARLD